MARDQRANSMSRRSFCSTFVGLLVAPGIAIAQASKVVRRIAVASALLAAIVDAQPGVRVGRHGVARGGSGVSPDPVCARNTAPPR